MSSNVAITWRPLTQWPAGRKQTPAGYREEAKFKSSTRQVRDPFGNLREEKGKRTSVETTYDELDRELWAIGATDVVVQIDVRHEGHIRRDASRPLADASVSSPAIVLTFKRKGTVHTFACDQFTRWQDNLRGIVLGLEGLRRLERYGIVQAGEQYRGWQALPSTTSTALSTEAAADVLARRAPYPAGGIITSRDTARAAYRAAAAVSHPDRHQGSTVDFQLVGEAKRVLEAHHGGTL